MVALKEQARSLPISASVATGECLLPAPEATPGSLTRRNYRLVGDVETKGARTSPRTENSIGPADGPLPDAKQNLFLTASCKHRNLGGYSVGKFYVKMSRVFLPVLLIKRSHLSAPSILSLGTYMRFRESHPTLLNSLYNHE